jgi:hypothetical protein
MRKLLGIVMIIVMQILILMLVLYAQQFGPVARVLTFTFALVFNVLMVLAIREYRRTQ